MLLADKAEREERKGNREVSWLGAEAEQKQGVEAWNAAAWPNETFPAAHQGKAHAVSSAQYMCAPEWLCRVTLRMSESAPE